MALIGVFGAAGALTRLGISNVIDARSFPWATLLINVTGSFALGVLLTWGATRLSHDVGSALAIGFLGAYTTYSTFAVDVAILGDDGRMTAAAVNLATTVVLGVAAATAGIALGRTLVDA